MINLSVSKNKISNITIDKMKNSAYVVHLVFQMLGMLANLQAPCKNSDVIRWLIIPAFVICYFLSFSISESSQGNDKCLDVASFYVFAYTLQNIVR